MAKFNLDYYQSEDGYSDGDVESFLLEELKSGKTASEILLEDDRWPVYYHLIPKRENILNWYPFKKDSDILEIGSGLGALTGMLSEKAKNLVSVELTKPRAEVNFERNKDKENLEIIVGNLNNIDFEKKFDYIILNGVLEYAISFTDSDKPFEDFLKKIKSLLKENGQILIAIENRLGLKYFNGVPEDHTAQLFSGLDGYPNIDFVRTFSKKELSDLLDRVGLNHQKFYYPNPDYKLPDIIYSDESLNLVDSRVNTDIFNINRVQLFNESEVLKALLNENIADRFFNSFLVVASPEKIKESEEVIFTKISDKRKKEFQTKTIITKDNEGNKRVYKYPLTKDSQEHIDKMLQYYSENPNEGNLINVKATPFENGIEFDFINGLTIEEILENYLRDGNYRAFEDYIKEFSNSLKENAKPSNDFYSEDFKKYFGSSKSDPSLNIKSDINMDLLFSNILRDNEGKETVIDYEWICDFEVPVEYIIWRSLYYFYLKGGLSGSSYTLEDLYRLAKIDKDLEETFINWDEHFGNIFTKDNSEEKYIKETFEVTPQLNNLINFRDVTSTIYLDLGEGYSEDLKVTSNLKTDGDDFEVKFDLTPLKEVIKDKRIYNLRFDPIERMCKVKDLEIVNEDLDFYPDYKESDEITIIDDWIYFLNNDPKLEILGDYSNLEELIIKGKLEGYELDEALELNTKVLEKTKSDLNELRINKDREILQLQSQNQIIGNELADAKRRLEKVENLKVFKVAKSLRDRLKNIKK